MKLRVCRVDEVAPGTMRAFDVEGLSTRVLVANVAGELHVTSIMCPHDEVSLLRGRLEGARVICPGHGYAFELSDGRCSHDAALSLYRYPSTVRDGELFIALVAADAAAVGEPEPPR